MPHLDEGVLHAYLDGALPLDAGGTAEAQGGRAAYSRDATAESVFPTVVEVERHLSSCVECRAALEYARQLRDASASILAAAGPAQVVAPSFEELQTRAMSDEPAIVQDTGRRAAPPSGRLVPTRTLAWAATVVLAAMVGWYARSTLLTERPVESLTDAETDARLTIQIPHVETQAAAVDSQRQTAVGPRSESVEEMAPTSDADELVVEQETVPTVGGVDARSTEPAALEQPKGTRDSVSLVGLVRADSEEGVVSSVSQPAERSRAEALQARRTGAADAAPAPMMAQVGGGLGAGAETAWVTVDEERAREILERPIPMIPELPIVGYAVSGDESQRSVRVIQSLAAGDLVVLYVTAGDAGNVLDKKDFELSNAFNSVVVQQNDLYIRISANMTVDSLRSLGQKIVSR